MAVTYYKIVLIGLCCVFTSAVSAQNSWALKATKDGVNVYTRNSSSNVQELKLTTTLQTSLSGIAQLLSEVELYPKWGYKISEARVVKRISPNELYYYSRIDFPWPMSDRDVVMHTKLTQDPKTHVITAVSTAVPNLLPEVKDVVRLHKASTRWVITPQADGKLATEYYIHSDPGGSLPDWLVNMAIDVGPRETIKNMRGLLAQSRYRNARLAHVLGD
jgi:hypothetical protein